MKILITGATGFLGQHLVKHLKEAGYVCRPFGHDLVLESHLISLIAEPDDIVIHCAAKVGGIRFNLDYPASIYYENILMNTQLIDELAKKGIRKLIFVSSVCAYPHNTPIPTSEYELFQGEIEKSNEAYGFSKLAALVQLRACKRQYGLNFSYPLLANLYGPGDRGFTDASKAHLVPNLIKKFLSQKKVVMFGDGSLTRDLLYVGDAVEAITKMIEVDYDEPVNIATGREVSKREIVDAIISAIQSDVEVEWDNKPDKGELRRCYDISRANQKLPWYPKTDIQKGIERTIKWYKSL